MASEQLPRAMQFWRDALATIGEKPTLWERRIAFERLWDEFPPPADMTYEPVGAGGVPGEWIIPPLAPTDRAILYLHGGGYVIGSLQTHREMVCRMALAAGSRALLIDYRLAPENPFPAAVEDAVAAYRWLLGQGIQHERIVIAGDSAGGGLTVATLVALRYFGLPLPAAGVCLSPWTDLAATGESLTTKAHVDPIVQKDLLLQMAAAYLGGADAQTPLASPLYADLTGRPPLLVQVGTAETLLDDATRLAERARQAGVDVTLDISEEMPHVWLVFGSFLPEAQQAIETAGEFMRKHLQ